MATRGFLLWPGLAGPTCVVPGTWYRSAPTVNTHSEYPKYRKYRGILNSWERESNSFTHHHCQPRPVLSPIKACTASLKISPVVPLRSTRWTSSFSWQVYGGLLFHQITIDVVALQCLWLLWPWCPLPTPTEAGRPLHGSRNSRNGSLQSAVVELVLRLKHHRVGLDSWDSVLLKKSSLAQGTRSWLLRTFPVQQKILVQHFKINIFQHEYSWYIFNSHSLNIPPLKGCHFHFPVLFRCPNDNNNNYCNHNYRNNSR